MTPLLLSGRSGTGAAGVGGPSGEGADRCAHVRTLLHAAGPAAVRHWSVGAGRRETGAVHAGAGLCCLFRGEASQLVLTAPWVFRATVLFVLYRRSGVVWLQEVTRYSHVVTVQKREFVTSTLAMFRTVCVTLLVIAYLLFICCPESPANIDCKYVINTFSPFNLKEQQISHTSSSIRLTDHTLVLFFVFLSPFIFRRYVSYWIGKTPP